MGKYFTLAETIVKLVHEKKMDSPEFETIVAYYGIDRVRKIYRKERDRERSEQRGRDKCEPSSKERKPF